MSSNEHSSPVSSTTSWSLPSLTSLDFSKPSTASFATDATSLAHDPNGSFPGYKPQLPALSVDQASRRPVPSGRPGSPFSFGNPPPYPRTSSTYDQSAERDLVPEMDMEQQEQSRAAPGLYGPPRLPLDHESASRDHFPDGFDYNMRRHSIAALQSSDSHHVQADPSAHNARSPFHPSLNKSRKVSHSSMVFNGHTPVEQEYPPETYRSPMEPEPPKRRASAFDTRVIAQMSLNERRDSVDSARFVPPGPNWWDRRDSTTSLYSNASASSMGGYASSFSGDSKQQWNQRTPQPQLPDTLPPNARPFPTLPDPRTPTASTHGPSPYDRRMSVPDAALAAAGAVRNFRSRSRPPSRGLPNQNVTPPHVPQITATLVNPNDHYGDPNMAMAQQPQQQQQTPVSANSTPGMLVAPKEAATPYSRSPELRISHKLAERKRRKEMKDLFDELRDNLPADRGMKSSKWEILSKAIDYINQLRGQQHDMAREIESLKSELDAVRGGVPATNGHHSYGQSTNYQQGSYNATPPGSRASHYPAAGPPPPAL